MAYLPVSNISQNYRDYGAWWAKAYYAGTTTPKPMALESDGGTQVAKLEVNIDGFFVSAGGAIVIPYISGIYDFYLFPTEAEADANTTINAVRIADGIQMANGFNANEDVELVSGQTTVTLTAVNADIAVIYIQGDNVDRGKLLKGLDYTVPDGSTIELNSSRPAGSVISAFGLADAENGAVTSFNTRTGAVAPFSGDYTASQVDNIPAGTLVAINVQAAINELEARGSWSTPKAANFTAVSRDSRLIDASANTIDVALPVLTIGNSFIYHNLITSTFKVQILNPIETIKGNNGDIAAGTNMELSAGDSVQLVAVTATILAIVGAQI